MAKKQNQSVRSRIAEYLYSHHNATKAELASELSISMPTLLSNVSSMSDEEILIPDQMLESTGGRKATALALNPQYACAAGISITKSNINMVLLDFAGSILGSVKIPYSFTGTQKDLDFLSEQFKHFLAKNAQHPKLLGCGIALPGIINKKARSLTKSHVLDLQNYSLGGFQEVMPVELLFENDANAALLAERLPTEASLIFLNLGRTVGGTLFNQGQIAQGDHFRAGEFGHMILYPNGKTCYCGKKGCADPYCSTSSLLEGTNQTLNEFMKDISNNSDPVKSKRWDELLDTLALLCSNLRMAFDMDIMIGGPLSSYIKSDLSRLNNKIKPLDLFDRNPDYLRIASKEHLAPAIGAAELFILHNIQSLK